MRLVPKPRAMISARPTSRGVETLPRAYRVWELGKELRGGTNQPSDAGNPLDPDLDLDLDMDLGFSMFQRQKAIG
jgi:hypothetical protein